ncbi:MAG: carboxypeptidase regulatory-like domain-containing protein [Phycisphaerae bacterium]
MKACGVVLAGILACAASEAGEVEETLKQKVSYTEVEAIEGGTISGKVFWSGDVPEVTKFPINKNVEVCAKHAKKEMADSPRLIIDKESKGVENAVVFLADIREGKSLETIETPVFDQKNCTYDPHILLIRAGARLQMKSSDDILHNIHAVGPSKFNKPFPLRNTIIKQKMRKPGVSVLSCDAGHSWMSAYIFVVQHPYFALTDEKGDFVLKDVPAGTYKLMVWHEGWTVAKTDSDSEGKITRYTFDAPKETQKSVTVSSAGEVEMRFALSAEGLEEQE